ncbi:MAG: protein-disulfide reductase DsbD domain-containing protein [Planctomycetota bacterium]
MQTEGYQDERGFLIGVVSHGAGMEDSPDAEYISSGRSTKGADAVAIGRQGNFLHWGFAASPTHFTDEAKLVFVNSIHYISRFAGQRPIVRKPSGVRLRSSVDDMLYGLSDEGYERWTEMIDDANARLQREIDKVRERKEAGETLSKYDEQILQAKADMTWNRGDVAKYVVPPTLASEWGEDWSKYRAYYTDNRPYLRTSGEGHRQTLAVDEDVKGLGIPNDDPRLLETCVAMLERGEQVALARRVLERYTPEQFDDAAGWRAWLDANRDRLFFTECGGYKFMVDTIGQPPREAGAGAWKMPATTPRSPVALAAKVTPARAATGDTVNLVLRAKMHAGWHVYAHVPATLPYIVTTMKLQLPAGVTAASGWKSPESKLSAQEAGVRYYAGDVRFERELSVAGDVRGPLEVVVVVDYQACDSNICLPPRTVELPVRLTIE